MKKAPIFTLILCCLLFSCSFPALKTSSYPLSTIKRTIGFNHRNQWHFLSRSHSYMQAFKDYRFDQQGFPHALISVHPKTPDGTAAVSDLETSNFSQGLEDMFDVQRSGFEVISFTTSNGEPPASNLALHAEIEENGGFRTETN